jgi:predicted urease superfamily metal-dependent hydrolase
MSSIFVGMHPDQIRVLLENVDLQAEKKLEQTLTEAVEKAKRTECRPAIVIIYILLLMGLL